MQISVYGEGKHEVGTATDRPLVRSEGHALVRLVDGLLGQPKGAMYVPKVFHKVKHIRGGVGTKFTKKVMAAIFKAKQESDTGLVIVIDCDDDSDRIVQLEQGRDDTLYDSSYVPCAVGMATKTFDAWMLADHEAVRQAGGSTDGLTSQPESLSDPKETAQMVFSSNGLAEIYCRVVDACDPEAVAGHSKSFKRFAKDVQKHLLPGLANA